MKVLFVRSVFLTCAFASCLTGCNNIPEAEKYKAPPLKYERQKPSFTLSTPIETEELKSYVTSEKQVDFSWRKADAQIEPYAADLEETVQIASLGCSSLDIKELVSRLGDRPYTVVEKLPPAFSKPIFWDALCVGSTAKIAELGSLRTRILLFVDANLVWPAPRFLTIITQKLILKNKNKIQLGYSDQSCLPLGSQLEINFLEAEFNGDLSVQFFGDLKGDGNQCLNK